MHPSLQLLEMFHVHTELVGMPFVIHCYFRALGVQNRSSQNEFMEESRGEREGGRNVGISLGIMFNLHSDLPQTPEGTALRLK